MTVGPGRRLTWKARCSPFAACANSSASHAGWTGSFRIDLPRWHCISRDIASRSRGFFDHNALGSHRIDFPPIEDTSTRTAAAVKTLVHHYEVQAWRRTREDGNIQALLWTRASREQVGKRMGSHHLANGPCGGERGTRLHPLDNGSGRAFVRPRHFALPGRSRSGASLQQEEQSKGREGTWRDHRRAV